MASWLICVILAICITADASIFDHKRYKRQTIVSTNAETNGVADDVESSAMSHHYKNADGVVGMNVSSAGNATGANSASIENNAEGRVGDTSMSATGNVDSKGKDSMSYSDIFAVVAGENKTIASFQQGRGSGLGDTSAQATGQATMETNGNPSPLSSDKTIATAGATGSQGSQSEVMSNQVLTWDSLLAKLVGSAVAEGIGNAQANVDLGAGNANNGVEMNGVVSGVQTNGGNVNSQVNGNANMDGDKHDLVGNMYGQVKGDGGNSSLVGATHLNSNTTTNSSISSFSDSNIASSGSNKIDMMSETDLDNKKGANGHVLTNGTSNSADHAMTVQNGLKVKDTNGETLAIGNGAIHGSGTENSNASIIVDTSYNQNGDPRIIAKGEGQAVSNDKNSTLNIGANADVSNSNGLNNTGYANASGIVHGEYNNLTGVAFLNVDNVGANGNAMMEARGGGAGNSSAQTNTALELGEGDQKRNASVNGAVSASGDKTSVHSISVVTDNNGEQTLSNYQRATSNSKGSSSASASNYGVLKRRKRSYLGVLYDKVF
ncbi:unnamed protein product [Auanema sp. JU1783]|nr:unnamed protein product [Auanema sp. JU1783]